MSKLHRRDAEGADASRSAPPRNTSAPRPTCRSPARSNTPATCTPRSIRRRRSGSRGDEMRRRDFITLLGGAALAACRSSRARRSAMRRIGVLMGFAENDREGAGLCSPRSARDFSKLGWTEGHNIRIDTRWATPGGDTPSMTAIRKGARRAAARSHSVGHHTHDMPRCCNKRAPSRSFSRPLPIRSAAVSSRAFRGRAATSPVSLRWSRRWPASGWSCSRRLRRASPGSLSCSIRQRRRISNIT